MKIDVEMAVYHYHFMVRYYSTITEDPGITKERREYLEMMKKSIEYEIKIMVSDNDYNIYNSVLSMYMKSDTLVEFVRGLFNSKEMLTRKMIYLAWSQGNMNVIQNCVELDIDTEPQRNISCAIRSDSINMVDTCVGLGASLKLPFMPYRHCRSIEMMNHLSKKYKCKLYDMATGLCGNNLLSIEYMFLGGHIAIMGTLNKTTRCQGNIYRSLPIKMAFVRSRRKDNTKPLEGLGRCLLLPGFVVKNITEYI